MTTGAEGLGAAEVTWEDPQADRRGVAVSRILHEQGLDEIPAYDPKQYEDERFVTRARTLFYARLAFLGIGLGVLAIPRWSSAFGVRTLWAFAVYFVMVGYSIGAFLCLDRPKLARPITFLTLCLDLVVMVYMITASGGLHSPLLATQLMFTTLFVILFPKPLAILPPLLTLPIVAKIDQMVFQQDPAVLDLFVLIWYSAINFIVVYVMVYLNERDQTRHQEVVTLQQGLKDLAVVEERNRIAREIHDGLGASLSSLIIEAEYLQTLARKAVREGKDGEALIGEIVELKGVAEESIDELRRNISMMRDDFDLLPALEDYCHTFAGRARLEVRFQHRGRPPELPPSAQLTIFRVLQECLTNVARHAGTDAVEIDLTWARPALTLVVEDHGKGFETGGTLKGHYGLTNMAERAKKAGGHLDVASTPGEGTRVTLVLDVTRSE